MEIIQEFLKQYNKQYDFYLEIARIGDKKIESEVTSRGIKAIVSYRAKRPDRLKDKLSQRQEVKKYKNVQDIFEDIVDLAGVRVALYFPSDRELIDEIVKDLFEIKKKKDFPESSHKPKHTKRFSGYWATHYRVTLKKTDKEHDRFQGTQFEIQVASVLMHAWAEVEHDLVYKPLSGGLSEEELSILDQINGLVLSGEIALELLQKAMTKRTKESKEINDKYELTNFIVSSLGKNYLNKLKLGNTNVLNNYFKTINKLNTDTFSKYINNINQSAGETISDQLLNMFISEYLKDNIKGKSLQSYLKTISGPNKDTSGFELFIKTWIILEKGISIINEENNVMHRKYFVPKFDILLENKSFTNAEIAELHHFRKIRNQLLHGIETPPNEYLNDAYVKLRDSTTKIIEQIKNDDNRNKLMKELNELEVN